MKDLSGNVGIYQLHNGLILEKRLAGETLQQIGDEFGVSRERVRQVLEHRFKTKGIPFMKAKDVVAITGLSQPTITRKARKLGLRRTGSKKNSHYIWDKDSLEKLLAGRRCRVCGDPIPSLRHVFCSTKCRNKSQYRFWPPEQKANHRQLVKKWHDEHPEQVRAIARQASKKWDSIHEWKHYKCLICGNEIPYGLKRRKYCLDCLPQGMYFQFYKGKRIGPFKKTQPSS